MTPSGRTESRIAGMLSGCSRSATTASNGADSSRRRAVPVTRWFRAACKLRFNPSRPLAPVTKSLMDPASCSPRLAARSPGRLRLFEGRDQPLDALHIQPHLVGVAGIPEAIGQCPAVILQRSLPQRLRWLDDEHAIGFDGISRL